MDFCFQSCLKYKDYIDLTNGWNFTVERGLLICRVSKVLYCNFYRCYVEFNEYIMGPFMLVRSQLFCYLCETLLGLKPRQPVIKLRRYYW